MAEENTGITTEGMDSIVPQLLAMAAVVDAIEADPAFLESLYALGYKFYSAGSYKDAETLFKALCVYSRRDARFWMGFAGCLQAQGEFKDAIDAYAMAAKADLQDPTPLLQAARCHLGLGDKEKAIGALNAISDRVNMANPDHVACYSRATALLALLENEG